MAERCRQVVIQRLQQPVGDMRAATEMGPKPDEVLLIGSRPFPRLLSPDRLVANRWWSYPLWLPIAASLLLSGCTAAYNTRTITSPDGKYEVVCHIRGALGRSYVAETQKKIAISIFATGTTNTLLLTKTYRIRGSALEWKSAWDDDKSLSLTFYDDGPNVDTDELGTPKRLVKSMSYHFDPRTGNVSEQPAQDQK
jgi:hypothetical protein